MNKVLFIDTLTTGMNPERCSIYRLGGIYTEDDEEKARFEIRMRPFPNARINEQSIWISGESRSSLLVYPKEEDAFAFFINWLDSIVNVKNPNDKVYLAGYNCSGLDMPFLREWFRRNGNERFRDYFHVQVIDVMSIAAFALMASRSRMPDFHIETTARFLEVVPKETAVYDCLSKAKTSLDIYRKLEKRFGLAECLNTDEIADVVTNYKK